MKWVCGSQYFVVVEVASFNEAVTGGFASRVVLITNSRNGPVIFLTFLTLPFIGETRFVK